MKIVIEEIKEIKDGQKLGSKIVIKAKSKNIEELSNLIEKVNILRKEGK